MVQTRDTVSQVDSVDLNTPLPPPLTASVDQGLGQFMAAQTQLMMQNMNQIMTQQNRTATTTCYDEPEQPNSCHVAVATTSFSPVKAGRVYEDPSTYVI